MKYEWIYGMNICKWYFKLYLCIFMVVNFILMKFIEYYERSRYCNEMIYLFDFSYFYFIKINV